MMMSCKPFSRACAAVSTKATAKTFLTNNRLRTFTRKRVGVVAFKEDNKSGAGIQEKANEKLNQTQQGMNELKERAQDAFRQGGGSMQGPEGFQRTLEDLQTPKEDSNAYKAPLVVPIFSRRREIWVGRWAMVGFLAAIMGEVATGGMGPMAQVSHWTGLSLPAVRTLLLSVLAFSFAGTISGPTYSEENQRDVAKRETPLPGNPSNNLQQQMGWGKGFGFTKANELVNGRIAMLGFLGVVIGELYLATGPIGQLAHHLNVAPDYTFATQGLALSFFAALSLAYLNGNFGQPQDDDHVY